MIVDNIGVIVGYSSASNGITRALQLLRYNRLMMRTLTHRSRVGAKRRHATPLCAKLNARVNKRPKVGLSQHRTDTRERIRKCRSASCQRALDKNRRDCHCSPITVPGDDALIGLLSPGLFYSHKNRFVRPVVRHIASIHNAYQRFKHFIEQFIR